MPRQMPLGHIDRQAIVEYAFHIFVFQILFVHEIRMEKGRRRELFGIADDHRALTARKRTDRFRRGNLRSFVEDHHIEQTVFRLQILRNGDRAHKHTGRKPFDKLGNFFKEFSKPVATKIGFFQTDEIRHFQTQTPFRILRRHARDQFSADRVFGKPRKFFHRKAQAFCLFFRHCRRETGKHGIKRNIRLQEVFINVLFKAIDNILTRNRTVFKRVGNERQARFIKRFRRLFIHTPRREHIDIFNKRARFGHVIIKHVFFGRFRFIRRRCQKETLFRSPKAFKRRKQAFQNRRRITACRTDTHTVKTIRVIIHKHRSAKLVQAI